MKRIIKHVLHNIGYIEMLIAGKMYIDQA